MGPVEGKDECVDRASQSMLKGVPQGLVGEDVESDETVAWKKRVRFLKDIF